MASPLQDPDWLRKSIQKAIQTEIETIIDVEVKDAARRVERSVRERVGQISAAVLSKFAMHYMGQKLIIEVDFHPDGRTPTTPN
jgi:hypothetical protein